MVSDGALAWLVDASYDAGQVNLRFVRASDLETIKWTDNFQPYYLIEAEHSGETVPKVNLFTQETVSLQKVNYVKKPPKDTHAWEAEIDPALSYVYDNGLRFGLLHTLKDDHWLPQASLDAEQSSRFDRLFDDLREKNPLKLESVCRGCDSTCTTLNVSSQIQCGFGRFLGWASSRVCSRETHCSSPLLSHHYH